MKFFHLSDLHIGKKLNGFDLSEEQIFVFDQIIKKAKEIRPDAIVIAGDVYDKSEPSGDAFNLFDDFLDKLSEINPPIPVLISAGNHDNRDRLNFASSFLEKHNIYISTSLPANESEHLKKVVLKDEIGDVNFYILPFTRPADARNLTGEAGLIKNYDDAVAVMINRENIDFTERNVLISHQFYIKEGQELKRCDSETRIRTVGGIDSVDISRIEKFDYAALGHIHSSQKVGFEHIRYCGTPLKYSISEADDAKSITVVELKKKGEAINIEYLPLEMKHDIKCLKGTLNEVLNMANDKLKHTFVHITLTDEEILFRPKEVLAEKYNKIIDFNIENTRTKAILKNENIDFEDQDPRKLFMNFYKEMNNQEMNEKEIELLDEVLKDIQV